MLARRGVIADQLTDSQVQEVLDNSPSTHETLRSQSQTRSRSRSQSTSTQNPFPLEPQSQAQAQQSQTTTTASKPSDIFSPATMESASTKKPLLQGSQGGKRHNHHQWDALPGITSEAEVIRQVKEMQREQEQWERGRGYADSHEYGGINRPQSQSQKPKAVVEGLEGGLVGSTVTFREQSKGRGQDEEGQHKGKQDKGKQRERSESRGRRGRAGERSHESNTTAGDFQSQSQSRSRERSLLVGTGGGERTATEGYDPVDYDRGAYVETSRVGLE
ncbi:hypothetical protein SMACR_05849 [Sordaria macrospora]|uniref:WGS project CABT00000000 data, contig 2.24 n=2 Tax=Sordaria macrospora TaxID=5147 RepID=F7W3A9_SORMK|nr:uncharacterized protein SMAC_05849 [Sordaria macrospora k-hell]KAA8629485.1 hypothetical protein SMACR_05849 [Sordaria macrospora]KAH7627859.1 hypothetical protein B0T09DRAFT_402614 [Sordaria sp. MPI-SDFR-AT-0083]WPJ65315.1 hypothetical protein SMAC4_05849 [Sordaria macrospora]CCC12111.1 unnamed protein product [Sordaria macrospora k-hell]